MEVEELFKEAIKEVLKEVLEDIGLEDIIADATQAAILEAQERSFENWTKGKPKN